jgi:hypothetical protein
MNTALLHTLACSSVTQPIHSRVLGPAGLDLLRKTGHSLGLEYPLSFRCRNGVFVQTSGELTLHPYGLGTVGRKAMGR